MSRVSTNTIGCNWPRRSETSSELASLVLVAVWLNEVDCPGGGQFAFQLNLEPRGMRMPIGRFVLAARIAPQLEAPPGGRCEEDQYQKARVSPHLVKLISHLPNDSRAAGDN